MPVGAQPPVTLSRILHPCVVLTRGEIKVLIDPCFGSFTSRFVTSRIFGVTMPAPGLRPEDLAGLTAIALTHGHEDHFDEEALARLPDRSPRVFVGEKGLARRIRRLGFREVESLAPWEAAAGDGWKVTAAPARAPNALREVSFVVDLGGFRVFHGGDTATHGLFTQIGDRLAPHAACLPVNGVSLLGVRLTMTPHQASRAAADLGVLTAVPIHDEMSFRKISRLLYRTSGDGRAFREAVRRYHPEIRVLLPGRGETIALEPAP